MTALQLVSNKQSMLMARVGADYNSMNMIMTTHAQLHLITIHYNHNWPLPC